MSTGNQAHTVRVIWAFGMTKAFVLEIYLLTRQLREYLTRMLAVAKGREERIER